MKVLFVNDLAFIVEAIHGELARRGVASEVVGRRISGPPAMTSTFLRNVAGIQSSLLRSHDFDILHINYGLFGFFAYETLQPKVLHCHGSDIRPGRKVRARIANLLTRSSMRLADRIWYATTDLAPYIVNDCPSARYMPNPVSDEFFSVPPAQTDSPRVLFAVPLTYLKGADIAAEAMQMIARLGLRAGVQAFEYSVRPGESEEIRRKIPTSVKGIPWTSHSEMPQMMSEANVVVGRLRLGSLGITELEAMASGRPLILHQQGLVAGPQEYYQEEPPVISCSTAQEVAEAVKKCVEDPSFAKDLGLRGRAWVLKYHSPAVVAELYAKEYRSLISASVAA